MTFCQARNCPSEVEFGDVFCASHRQQQNLHMAAEAEQQTVTLCDIATVTIESTTGQGATFEVPAYTVPLEQLLKRIEYEWFIYQTRTTTLEHSTVGSLADFAFYLLAQATMDPREIGG